MCLHPRHPPPISIKSRTFTALSSPTSRSIPHKPSLVQFQRRFASDEVATQSEPEADGATEAEHGDNSIAAASTESVEPPKNEGQADDLTAATLDSSTTKHVADQPSSATGSVTEQATGAAQSAARSVAGTAAAAGQSLSEAAGISTGKSDTTYAKGGEASKVVYVGNLFFDVRAEDLKREFERAGPVVDVKIIMDARGLSKGLVTP